MDTPASSSSGGGRSRTSNNSSGPNDDRDGSHASRSGHTPARSIHGNPAGAFDVLPGISGDSRGRSSSVGRSIPSGSRHSVRPVSANSVPIDEMDRVRLRDAMTGRGRSADETRPSAAEHEGAGDALPPPVNVASVSQNAAPRHANRVDDLWREVAQCFADQCNVAQRVAARRAANSRHAASERHAAVERAVARRIVGQRIARRVAAACGAAGHDAAARDPNADGAQRGAAGNSNSHDPPQRPFYEPVIPIYPACSPACLDHAQRAAAGSYSTHRVTLPYGPSLRAILHSAAAAFDADDNVTAVCFPVMPLGARRQVASRDTASRGRGHGHGRACRHEQNDDFGVAAPHDAAWYDESGNVNVAERPYVAEQAAPSFLMYVPALFPGSAYDATGHDNTGHVAGYDFAGRGAVGDFDHWNVPINPNIVGYIAPGHDVPGHDAPGHDVSGNVVGGYPYPVDYGGNGCYSGGPERAGCSVPCCNGFCQNVNENVGYEYGTAGPSMNHAAGRPEPVRRVTIHGNALQIHLIQGNPAQGDAHVPLPPRGIFVNTRTVGDRMALLSINLCRNCGQNVFECFCEEH